MELGIVTQYSSGSDDCALLPPLLSHAIAHLKPGFEMGNQGLELPRHRKPWVAASVLVGGGRREGKIRDPICFRVRLKWNPNVFLEGSLGRNVNFRKDILQLSGSLEPNPEVFCKEALYETETFGFAHR